MEKDEFGLQESQESERLARKRFELELKNTQRDKPIVYLEYSKLLSEEQIRLAKENSGKPVKIVTERREGLLRQAHINVYIGHVNPERMERDWEGATSKDGRPPIGGAQDD